MRPAAARPPGRTTKRRASRTAAAAALGVCSLLATPVHPAPAAAAGPPPTTVSRYEPTADPATLRAQGASDGHGGLGGVAILDYGRPAQTAGGTMATEDFAGHVDPLPDVVAAAEAYADGYRHAAPPGASMLVLIGTNDSCGEGQPCGAQICGCANEPSSYLAWGRAWGGAVAQLGSYLSSTAAASAASASGGGGYDAEPAYDPAFTNTFDVVAGYDEVTTLPMVDFGSIDGGPSDGFWTAEQMYLVAYGLRPDVAFPEIYHPGMAGQWADLLQWSAAHTGATMAIAGVLTESPDGYSPQQAYANLLAAVNTGGPGVPPQSPHWSSNMVYVTGGS
jgi:hypothetical protein